MFPHHGYFYGMPFGYGYGGVGDPNIAPAGIWLVVTTVSAQTGVPLIEHRFYGQTPEDAQARYQTHMKADAFIRECGQYDDQVHNYNGTPCKSTWRWERA